MRFMMLYKPGRESDAPPSSQEMAAVGQLIQEMMSAGVLIATEGLQPSSKGARVRISGSEFVVTDGPFAETKDLRTISPTSLRLADDKHTRTSVFLAVSQISRGVNVLNFG